MALSALINSVCIGFLLRHWLFVLQFSTETILDKKSGNCSVERHLDFYGLRLLRTLLAGKTLNHSFSNLIAIAIEVQVSAQNPE